MGEVSSVVKGGWGIWERWAMRWGDGRGGQ